MNKKETKDKLDLSIPPLSDTIFVIELEEYILATGFPVKECIFPIYRFDDEYGAAMEAADNIAKEQKKLVVNAVDFSIYDPHVYDPIKIDAQMKSMIEVFVEERKRIMDARAKFDKNKD